jgi:hypothetical protein
LDALVVRLISCVFLLQIPLALTVVMISRSDKDDNFMKTKVLLLLIKTFYEFKVCGSKSFFSYLTASQHTRYINYSDHKGSNLSLEKVLGEVALSD